ncbi:40s ribosomal protein s5-1 [Hordeum vulgare]|nr:40s ribosomal protein s5-1 [Hordeum vulgare]
MLHMRDVEGPKKTGSMETRLEAMGKQVFKCQGMVERGLNANHMMITEFTNNHQMDAIDTGKHLSRLCDRVDQLQGQIYDLLNQNYEYEYRFKSIRPTLPQFPWVPTATTRARTKLNSYVEDEDFIRDDASFKTKTVRKEYANTDEMIARESA